MVVVINVDIKESWRYCHRCMDRVCFILMGRTWFCKACGVEYGKKGVVKWHETTQK